MEFRTLGHYRKPFNKSVSDARPRQENKNKKQQTDVSNLAVNESMMSECWRCVDGLSDFANGGSGGMGYLQCRDRGIAPARQQGTGLRVRMLPYPSLPVSGMGKSR